jgi:hypothetical protein
MKFKVVKIRNFNERIASAYTKHWHLIAGSWIPMKFSSEKIVIIQIRPEKGMVQDLAFIQNEWWADEPRPTDFYNRLEMEGFRDTLPSFMKTNSFLRVICKVKGKYPLSPEAHYQLWARQNWIELKQLRSRALFIRKKIIGR